MAVTVTEIVEDAIPYRITEDTESGLYIKESLQEPPQPEPRPSPTERIAQLEAELLQSKLALAELAEANEQDKIDMQLALAELAEIITGGA